MSKQKQPALLTVKEAAAELRVSDRTVYRAIEAGSIPARRVGRLLRIRREDLDRKA
jgi:excisionase family DNA binding protein